MTARLITASLMALSVAVSASAPAKAETITLGLQEAGFNGGAITTIASQVAFPGLVVGPIGYGTFTVNSLTSTDSAGTNSAIDFGSTSLNVSGIGGNTLNVYLTEQGVPYDPTNNLPLSSVFTENSLDDGWTVNQSTWLDSGNGLFTTVTPLGSATFVGPNSSFSNITNIANTTPGSLFSVTELFTITLAPSVVAPGHDLSTITVIGTPEPSTWAMMALGFAGLGLVGWRSRRLAMVGGPGLSV